MKEQALELLQGGYDLHVHTSPSHFERKLDDFECAREMGKYQMAGCLIKIHFGSTASRAWIANRYSGSRTKLFGALTLDWPAGGLNLYAVDSELQLGAKIVYMPTLHAEADLITKKYKKYPVNALGITVFDQSGELLPVVYEIMDVVKKHGAVLATGHVSKEEAYALCKAGVERGVTMALTHPDGKAEKISLAMQKELADSGVFIEKSWLNVYRNETSIEEMSAIIREVSPERCFLSTDLGQKNNPAPVEGMLSFIEGLLSHGLSAEDIKTMGHINPARLMGEA